MFRGVLIVAIALVVPACTSDSATADGGVDGSSVAVDGSVDGSADASADGSVGDGGSSKTCIFGTSHFGDGCKFGP